MIWVRHKCKGCGEIRYTGIVASVKSRITTHTSGCGKSYRISKDEHIPNKGEDNETERM